MSEIQRASCRVARRTLLQRDPERCIRLAGRNAVNEEFRRTVPASVDDDDDDDAGAWSWA